MGQVTKLIYVASPIDHHTVDATLRGVIDEITTELTLSGAIVFHPERAFKVPDTRVHQPSGHVREINNRALDIAQGLLVFYPLGVKTWGVPAEIERALIQNKPVAFVTMGQGALSWSQMYTEAVYFRYPSVDAFIEQGPGMVSGIRSVFDLEEPPLPTFDDVLHGKDS